MKKILAIIIVFGAIVFFAGSTSAQMMGPGSAIDWDKAVEHTAKEEQEGKALWDKLQSKQVQCADFSDGDFDSLGEYFMGQMMGDSHAAMNAMMTQAHGEKGEEQIHIVMGKRLSGCDTSASFPLGGMDWMPMMQMMTGTGGANQSTGMMGMNQMMWGGGMWSGWTWLGGLFVILIWTLVILGVLALLKYLRK